LNGKQQAAYENGSYQNPLLGLQYRRRYQSGLVELDDDPQAKPGNNENNDDTYDRGDDIHHSLYPGADIVQH
jgi:hypothetical protein